MPTPQTNEHAASKTATLVKVLIAALLIRWVYCLALYFLQGDEALSGVDSAGLLANGVNFADAFKSQTLQGWRWFGFDPYIMPLFTWTATVHVLVFGKWATLSYALWQSVLDVVTCLLVYRMAAIINPSFAIPSVIAAAINPTQIVLCGYFYTDVFFVFFVALFLYGTVAWLSLPTWRMALLIGIGLGAGLLVRPVMAPWVAPYMAFLVITSLVRRDLSARRFGQIASAALIFAVCFGSLLLRNVAIYNAWSITAQSGMHLSRWVAPLVREAKDGTRWEKSYTELETRTVARFGGIDNNPFVQSDRYHEVAVEELRSLGLVAIAKAWLFGAAINIGAPAVILAQPIAHLPRTGFFATPGSSVPEKIWNFVFRSENNTYALVLLGGIIGVAIIRLIQLIGCVILVRQGTPVAVLLFFVGWIGYILFANGPISSPKYRLPLEPILCVLTGAGWATLRGKAKRSAPIA